VNGVSVTFRRGRSVVALDHIRSGARRRVPSIVGPSGSGKSTPLRVWPVCVARLRRRPHQADRPGTPLTAMVFQEHALLPWRTVRDNVTFGPENRGVGRVEREARARGCWRWSASRDSPSTILTSLGRHEAARASRALANDRKCS
jgi:ABC-type nitrate/sulfonate/bicarbonate transport system ATPase subunit